MWAARAAQHDMIILAVGCVLSPAVLKVRLYPWAYQFHTYSAYHGLYEVYRKPQLNLRTVFTMNYSAYDRIGASCNARTGTVARRGALMLISVQSCHSSPNGVSCSNGVGVQLLELAWELGTL
jgi:hypothetical protein